MGRGAFGVAITPDGSTAYVLSYCCGLHAKQSPVTLIRTATNTALPPVYVKRAPTRIAISADSATAYVSDTQAGEVVPISTATGKARAPIVVGKGAIAIAVTPDGRTVYVGIYSVVRRHFSTVIPIRAATGKVLPSITVGELPVAIAVTP